jgi:hypothetical protein
MRNDIITTETRIQPLSFPRIFYQFVTLNRDSDKLFSVILGALIRTSSTRMVVGCFKKKFKCSKHFMDTKLIILKVLIYLFNDGSAYGTAIGFNTKFNSKNFLNWF